MPQIKGAIKRVRQNYKVTPKNSAQMSAMRTAIKQAEQAARENADNKDALFKDAVSAIDTAESKGLVHKNKAARDKSRLSKIAAK
ncbi:30S ribosomal protein S20 [Tetragenococcus halophilus]|uniref:Small ribosomal subunit protein bS20 n=3 Tax=Tetragenococcus halophilus TaxID=51669 RepID=A0A2H6D420_TETHA|nr:30S ribosomal protein S20 [Tetragenococcus halophilus]AOF48861.1 30S ribosomal protein S20 [Tetragenococcus halophilus]MCF1601253.1 30S ribosomal protein S20 [Tetragenococcus halophilus]MCF1674998.1 30S ribosomal protein S20 [Tetragenococcus halophilus]MCF1685797.1 30S ribosomal protein S20 [Tetragenococcus halophilus]MCO7026537.1 30S ribosomal protein S20 [Tetragenococcus halophilus]